MAGPRRGILLGLGFTLEALKAAGLTDAQLDAPSEALLAPDGDVGTGIYDVEFSQSRTQIDVTTHNDAAPVYVPGISRAMVRFKVSQIAMHTWRDAIYHGEPMEFNEVVGNVRVSCRVIVREVVDQCSIDSMHTCLVSCSVVGAPTITQLTAAPAAPQQQKKDRGRRAIKLDGALID
jgi:hypothetical protein